MNIDYELKKEGIEVIKPLDTFSVINIAKSVATKLVAAFPEQSLNYDDLFIRLSRINMYIAKIPEGTTCAKYYYRNSSIYFSDNIDFTNIDSYAIHECIHSLQELKDDKNELIYLGLCDFTNSKLPGMALNEASVQLMSSKALNEKDDIVKYFDITFPTSSPYYYSLECNLVNQMAYVTGNYDLFNSTLYCNDNFKKKFISFTSEKIFYKVQNNLDKLIDLEDKLSYKSSLLGNSDITIKNIKKIEDSISNLRIKIKDLFISTQNLILTNYFDNNFNSISNLEQIEEYRKNLYNYKNLIGTTDNYTFFNEYYIQKMNELENLSYRLENPDEYALVPVNRSLFAILFSKIKKLFVHDETFEKVDL